MSELLNQLKDGALEERAPGEVNETPKQEETESKTPLLDRIESIIAESRAKIDKGEVTENDVAKEIEQLLTGPREEVGFPGLNQDQGIAVDNLEE